jgi:hypothetical protein
LAIAANVTLITKHKVAVRDEKTNKNEQNDVPFVRLQELPISQYSVFSNNVAGMWGEITIGFEGWVEVHCQKKQQ